jgi:hypothetical protein
MSRTKKALALCMVIGVLSLLGSAGSFASFSASTNNSGSSIASGTLTMSNQVNSGTVCLSTGATTGNNANGACSSILALSNVAPGVWGGTATVTVANTGSINASKMFLFAPFPNGVLSTAIGTTPITSLSVSSLEGTIASGDTINISYASGSTNCTASQGVAPSTTTTTINLNSCVIPTGGYPVGALVQDTSGNTQGTASPTALSSALSTGSPITSLPVAALTVAVTSGDLIYVTAVGSSSVQHQIFVASAGAAINATSIPVVSQTPNFAYPSGSPVTDQHSNNDCYDAQTTSAPAGFPGGTSFGTGLNFNPTTNNPFCAAALLYVQETTGGVNYCWAGNTSDAPTGGCTAPISVGLSGSWTPTTSSPPSIPVAALNGNVKAGDTVSIVLSTTLSDTCTVSTNEYIGANTIPLSSCTAAPGTFTTASTVTDTSTLSALNSDSTDTLTKFDTAHNQGGEVQLYPTVANGLANTGKPQALLSATASGSSVTSLSVSSLDGAIASTDSLTISSGTSSNTCTAGAAAAAGATTITINTCNLSNGPYPAGSTVTDTSQTITPPAALAADGSAGASRVFTVGLFLPAGLGSNQNNLQGLMSAFGLTWSVNQ